MIVGASLRRKWFLMVFIPQFPQKVTENKTPLFLFISTVYLFTFYFDNFEKQTSISHSIYRTSILEGKASRISQIKRFACHTDAHATLKCFLRSKQDMTSRTNKYVL